MHTINPISFSLRNEMESDRKISLQLGDVETTRDYAEIFSFEFDNEIMSKKFGNYWSLLLEGCSSLLFPRLVRAQDVHFFYTRSHLSALQNCTLLFSISFQFIFIFKNA